MSNGAFMKERLSFFQAAAVIAGAGVGSGVMAVPFLAAKSGILTFTLLLIVSFAVNAVLHLMFAEVMLRIGKHQQFVETMKELVFRGRAGNLIWIFFVVVGAAFIANIAAYTAGSAEIVASMTRLPPTIAVLIIYAFSAGIILFGLKVIGMVESYAVIGMAAFAVFILIASLRTPFQIPAAGTAANAISVYGIIMYCFYAFFAVPQVVKGLSHDRAKIAPAILTGLGVNAVITLVITVIAVGVSRPVTEIAVIGISKAFGGVSGTIGSIFMLLAFITSSWSVSLALTDIIRERFRLRTLPSWGIATAPSLILVLSGALRFLGFFSMAAGATALIIIMTTIPMYVNAKKFGSEKRPAFSLGAFGHPIMLAALTVAVIIMAIGAFLAA